MRGFDRISRMPQGPFQFLNLPENRHFGRERTGAFAHRVAQAVQGRQVKIFAKVERLAEPRWRLTVAVLNRLLDPILIEGSPYGTHNGIRLTEAENISTRDWKAGWARSCGWSRTLSSHSLASIPLLDSTASGNRGEWQRNGGRGIIFRGGSSSREEIWDAPILRKYCLFWLLFGRGICRLCGNQPMQNVVICCTMFDGAAPFASPKERFA